MAMNKAEAGEMTRLRQDLMLARALRWPDYPTPHPMTEAEIKASLTVEAQSYGHNQMVAVGWFQNTYTSRVTKGCSNGHGHNRNGLGTSTQGMGQMYATEADAYRAMRMEMTEDFAKNLAAVDAQIVEASPL
jgi:hypothetical protein